MEYLFHNCLNLLTFKLLASRNARKSTNIFRFPTLSKCVKDRETSLMKNRILRPPKEKMTPEEALFTPKYRFCNEMEA